MSEQPTQPQKKPLYEESDLEFFGTDMLLKALSARCPHGFIFVMGEPNSAIRMLYCPNFHLAFGLLKRADRRMEAMIDDDQMLDPSRPPNAQGGPS